MHLFLERTYGLDIVYIPRRCFPFIMHAFWIQDPEFQTRTCCGSWTTFVWLALILFSLKRAVVSSWADYPAGRPAEQLPREPACTLINPVAWPGLYIHTILACVIYMRYNSRAEVNKTRQENACEQDRRGCSGRAVPPRHRQGRRRRVHLHAHLRLRRLRIGDGLQ